ncbi:YcaO-like family protein [Methanolapillus ohkumae]
MELKSCPKVYQKETHRSKPPAETFACVEGLVEIAGITRVADITKLDRLDIPVFSCIRPSAAFGAISVYNGKGVTPIAARVSAIMEGLERYSAELTREDVPQLFLQSYPELSGKEKCVDPVEFILPNESDPDTPIPWILGDEMTIVPKSDSNTRSRDDPKTTSIIGSAIHPATDSESSDTNSYLLQITPVLIPAHAVYHPMPSQYYPLFRTGTNGIASGNTLEEAVYHALCEVIERDAWSLCEANKTGGRVIVDIDDEDICRLLSQFEKAGVFVLLRDITSNLGIPTIAAIADDITLKDPALLCLGMGTHSSPKIAALRALTEVAQSRATQIHGAREDTTLADVRKQMGYERTKRLNAKWFDESEKISFSAIPCVSHDDFLDEIKETILRLNKAGLSSVLVKDLTRPELNIPVVRVVVPGLESYAMDSTRAGFRFKEERAKIQNTGERRRRYVPET